MEDIAEHAQTRERTSGHFVNERVMVQPRLTGLEFSWFTKCQMMAANYAQHWDMSLEPDLGNLVQSIAAEARTSFTGSPSMRRVAERLALASDAMTAAGADHSARAEGEREETRCAEALLYVSSHLSRTAADVEAWKHASASKVQSNRTGPATGS